MSKSKYKQGKRIYSMLDFEESDNDWFKVNFGNHTKTVHRAFLLSWQYRLLKQFIDNKRVFIAERINNETRNNRTRDTK